MSWTGSAKRIWRLSENVWVRWHRKGKLEAARHRELLEQMKVVVASVSSAFLRYVLDRVIIKAPVARRLGRLHLPLIPAT